MALSQPVAGDKLNSPDHSLMHRQLATDPSANVKTVRVNSDDTVEISGNNDTTNMAKFAADGELNLHGTARIKKHFDFQNPDLGQGATKPAQVILGNYNGWEYDIADDSVVNAHLPADWAPGTDVDIGISWYCNEDYATNNGEVRWQAAWSAVPSDASEALDAPTHSGTDDTGDVNIPANAKTLTESTAETIPGASLSVGDLVGISISRIALVGGTDPTAKPTIVHVSLIYTANKLGEAT